MNLFFKIGAGVLSTLAITAGIVTAIPASRNFILNSVAPYSEVYQQKEQENKELQEAYISNLVLLAETRTSLLNAEFKAISYQNEIGVLRNTLSSTQENLTETISQKTYIEFSLNEANKNLTQITNELASLRQDFYELNSQMDSLIENDADQQEILALQQQIDELSQELVSKESLNDSLTIAVQSYEERLANNEQQIQDYENLIAEYENHIISLNSQIEELQETIRSLESLNNALDGDNSYKELVNQIVSGTITELNPEDLQGITEIKSYAFYNCTNLRSVILPEGIEVIGENAFANCTKLETVTLSSTVKRIEANAFERCSKLTSINLNDNIEYIGSFAFSSTNITEVYLPVSVSNWGSCIFQSAKVNKVTIAHGTTSIPFGTFISCPITEIYIPSSLQEIVDYTFGDTSTSMTVYYEGTQEQYEQIYISSDRNTQLVNAVKVYNFNY